MEKQVHKFLSVEQTAKTLNLPVSTVWRFVYRGDIPSVKLGHARRIPTSAIQAIEARAIEEARERRGA